MATYYNDQTPVSHHAPADDYFDPYAETHRAPHATYDQGGYRDDYYNAPAAGIGSGPAPPSGVPHNVEKDAPFSAAGLAGEPTPRKPSSNLRKYHYQKGNLWTKGGGLRACGRFLCCFLFTGVWMFVGIVLALVLYVRPPNVIIGKAQLAETNQISSLTGGGISIHAEIPIIIDNPTYLDVNLANLWAQIYYPINNTYIGNGTLTDTALPSFTNKNFTFPFAINYVPSLDPDQTIITDILKKCLAGKDLTVDYTLNVKVEVLSVPISHSVSESANLKCPIDASSVSSVLGGLNISSILGGLTGS